MINILRAFYVKFTVLLKMLNINMFSTIYCNLPFDVKFGAGFPSGGGLNGHTVVRVKVDHPAPWIKPS